MPKWGLKWIDPQKGRERGVELGGTGKITTVKTLKCDGFQRIRPLLTSIIFNRLNESRHHFIEVDGRCILSQ